VWEVVDGEPVLTTEGWYLNGVSHRIDRPSHREWEVVDGRAVLISEAWYLYGKRHRTDGPTWHQWEVVDGRSVLISEEWYLKGVKIHPRLLRQPVRAIERWWLFQQARRRQAIESFLWDSGMIVFPGLMDLL